MIHHVIFDMDGTLSDTALATTDSCAEAARQFALPPPDDSSVRAAMGWPVPTYWRMLYPHLSDEVLHRFAPVAERLENEYIARLGPGILFPGVEPMLRELLALGCTLYVASTGSREHVAVTLGSSGIAPLFSRIECEESDKTDMVGRILHGISPHDALMVGDRAKDADAARGNGIVSVGAAFGYCGPDERPLFDHIAESPNALIQLVQDL